MEDAAGEVTRLLQEVADGEERALDALLPVVYEELRKLASYHMGGERRDHTLDATALVHEAYIKLVGHERLKYKDRSHFFALAAQAMRRILINHGKSKRRIKRGGGKQRIPLEDHLLIQEDSPIDFLALDEALLKLQESSERAAKVVELRYFAGLGIQECAEVMQISATTVKEDWTMAKAWLLRELQKES